jgi:hypothetical protein
VNKSKGGIEEIEEKRGDFSSSFSSLTRNIKLTETSVYFVFMESTKELSIQGLIGLSMTH